MKNLTSGIFSGIFGSLTFFLLFLSLISSGQPPTETPWQQSTETFQPLYSFKPITAGAYYGTWLTTNQGSQRDTSCSGCRQSPLKLGTVKIIKRSASTDTTGLAPLYGQGKITVVARAYKASLTSTLNPTCVATLYGSDDGYSWNAVSGASVYTLSPTVVYSSTLTAAPSTCTWEGVTKSFLYYYAGFAVTVDTASFSCDAYFLKNQQLMLK